MSNWPVPSAEVLLHVRRPFLLPCLAAAALGMVAVTLSTFVLKESLPRMTGAARYAPGMSAVVHRLGGQGAVRACSSHLPLEATSMLLLVQVMARPSSTLSSNCAPLNAPVAEDLLKADAICAVIELASCKFEQPKPSTAEHVAAGPVPATALQELNVERDQPRWANGARPSPSRLHVTRTSSDVENQIPQSVAELGPAAPNRKHEHERNPELQVGGARMSAEQAAADESTLHGEDIPLMQPSAATEKQAAASKPWYKQQQVQMRPMVSYWHGRVWGGHQCTRASCAAGSNALLRAQFKLLLCCISSAGNHIA